jgi:DNA mismatch endonuclease (patch repair protein)
MADMLTPEQRSALMRRIPSRNTKPELVVRHVAHSMGYRYRLHKKGLPGSPDLVFVSRRKVVFVHGCFWHAHQCRNWRHPTTRQDYWAMRFAKNKLRDQRNVSDLKATGWHILVVWECETKSVKKLAARLRRFLGPIPH